jgi:hypothetical protein
MSKSGKRSAAIAAAAIATWALTGVAEAGLIYRGNGMVYDNVLDITWLQDVTYARTSGADGDGVFNYADANTWANNLVYGGFDDWRLPTLRPVNGGTQFSSVDAGARFNGTSDYGFNIAFPGGGADDPPSRSAGFTGNELAHMFHVNLGNLAQFKVNASQRAGVQGRDWGLVNRSFVDAVTGERVPFLNLRYEDVFDGFWTNREANPSYGWAFLHRGFNDAAFKTYWAGAWAVRNGDVLAEPPPPPPPVDPGQVPEPSTWALLLAGFAAMFAVTRRRPRRG